MPVRRTNSPRTRSSTSISSPTRARRTRRPRTKDFFWTLERSSRLDSGQIMAQPTTQTLTRPTFTRTSLAYSTRSQRSAVILAALGELLSQFRNAPAVGSLLGLLTFAHVFWGIFIIAAVVAAAVYVFTHLKWDFSVPGYDLKRSLRTTHFNELWMKFYDQELNPNVRYARHAISIDENRKK